jgi:hypothetical protein
MTMMEHPKITAYRQHQDGLQALITAHQQPFVDLLREWLAVPYFETRAEYDAWATEFRRRIEAELFLLKK